MLVNGLYRTRCPHGHKYWRGYIAMVGGHSTGPRLRLCVCLKEVEFHSAKVDECRRKGAMGLKVLDPSGPLVAPLNPSWGRASSNGSFFATDITVGRRLL